jgi:hypothetical protein
LFDRHTSGPRDHDPIDDEPERGVEQEQQGKKKKIAPLGKNLFSFFVLLGSIAAQLCHHAFHSDERQNGTRARYFSSWRSFR